MYHTFITALGPATTLCDSLIYSTAFLAVATTNLLATALADGKQEDSQKVVSHALAIGLGFGLLLLTVTLFAGGPMMAYTAGGNLSVIPAALKYRCFINLITIMLRTISLIHYCESALLVCGV